MKLSNLWRPHYETAFRRGKDDRDGRVTCELVDNKFIYPGNCKPADCLDALGFIDYIFPRCVIFSVVMLVLAVVYTLLSYVVKLSGMVYFDLAMIVLPVLAFVWFMYVQRKAAREFWGA